MLSLSEIASFSPEINFEKLFMAVIYEFSQKA
jgi:hypothetical protein